MTLRMRLAAAAGLAVALAVLAVSVAVYLGVRGELRSEVDASLHDRADAVARFAGRGPRRDGPRGRSGPPDRVPETPPEPFGGPQGFVQLVLPGGRVLRRPGAGEALPVGERARQVARSG
ncbi:MAG: hypothetical protein QOH58_1768, partial [Thermoleophilaceae bacterium]|nr:hypothetical protein [Thermoleophilaceae bacterium]